MLGVQYEDVSIFAMSDVINVMDGGDGNDYLLGGDRWEVLSGGAGDDYIEGGAGVDYFYWDGTGNDYVYDLSLIHI